MSFLTRTLAFISFSTLSLHANADLLAEYKCSNYGENVKIYTDKVVTSSKYKTTTSPVSMYLLRDSNTGIDQYKHGVNTKNSPTYEVHYYSKTKGSSTYKNRNADLDLSKLYIAKNGFISSQHASIDSKTKTLITSYSIREDKDCSLTYFRD